MLAAKHVSAFLILVLLFLAACSNPEETGEQISGDTLRPAPITRILPTPLPTNTSYPTPEPTGTRPPQATDEPNTPVAFDQVVVDLHYTIPALGLDRRITGNVSGHLEIIDETTGDTLTRRNQPGILIELQQSLSQLELSELPEECERCVQLTYDLPLAGQAGQGWLEDVQLLASLENYTSAVLGPYFPQGTVLGLRRSATAFHVAHTVALTTDGQLWRWSAVESEVAGPELLTEADQSWLSNLELSDLEELPLNFMAPCPYGPGVESLLVNLQGNQRQFQISCPELALPAALLPVYLPLFDLASDSTDEVPFNPPEVSLPLNGLLYYARSDGFQMKLLGNGMSLAIDAAGIAYTGTLTNSQVISLTTALIESGQLTKGVSSYMAAEWANILLVRGLDGVYEYVWQDPAEGIAPALASRLNDLLIQLTTVDKDGSTPVLTPSPRATSNP